MQGVVADNGCRGRGRECAAQWARLVLVLVVALAGLAPMALPAAAAPATTTSSSAQPTLRQGDRGDAVLRLQRRLVSLRYWLGSADGHFGPLTAQAVMAFQKVHRLQPDTVVGPATWSALSSPVRPSTQSRSGLVIEVNRSRQVLLRVVDGEVVTILNTSTGRSGMATPLGRYRIFREIDGWRHAPLGSLYRPKYFNEGIAIHGAKEVPAYPASHGCARVSLAAMDWLFDRAPIGTRVWVY